MIEQVTPEVVLVTYTGMPEIPAKAARFCTSSRTVQEILESCEGDTEVLERVMGLGHGSVLEHFSVTFGVSGISRVTETQFVRSRIASFSVKSGRYTRIKEFFQVVVPKALCGKFWRPKEPGHPLVAEISPIELIHMCHQMYLDLLAQGVAPEDARYILPQATATQLLVTMNARELLHFFSLRCCGHAQWEIRIVAFKMLAICKQLQPIIFKNAGPPCASTGFCTEQKSCGRKPRKTGE